MFFHQLHPEAYLMDQQQSTSIPSPDLPDPEALSDGLSVERVFSTDGEDPFDSVAWEKRDAEIKNPDGEVLFEQEDVEFPEPFSQLATNIVASKYFYGDLDDEDVHPEEGGREDSVRQLIHRVTRTIADWGKEQDYFASEEEAETFYDELTWLCLHQHGAFNSPVWFNVGLNQQYGTTDTGDTKISGWDAETEDIEPVDPYEYPQASACFIIDVEDSIDDIWQLMSESARLFKFGSGVGADWSTLRSTKEKLSGGGVPSGPVSFMRVQDETGDTIKSGGKTRRAAIMQTLKCWHPDVEKFVEVKQKEEKKAHALIDAGYDGSFNGPAYGSVAFQNVNQSLRVTGEFMKAAEQDLEYPLRAVTTGETVEKVKAREVLDKVSEGTHFCGDPGLQYEDEIQKWHTCKNTDQINSSNPCSEYMFLDNSACNLASLNLRKYQREDGSIDVERFRAAARVFITAQEILVSNAGYPSDDIAENSHDFRPLGLGFANLGALLMSMGLPYDSDEGRSVAAALMAIEHSEAYARSAEIAANDDIGPFNGYAENEEPMLEVTRMHRDEAHDLHESCPDYLREAAVESADRMVELGERHGYRNAQATVLAPTGTISFLMDCDTTGIEPDIALVKYKLLAGDDDGMFKIVNKTVPEALERLGYDDDEVQAITGYIDENDTIEGAPALKDEHLPVFDCAFSPNNGERSIHHMGHIKMMAAVQPFVSGAISKTVNVPEDADPDDIADAYRKGSELGLKALAIYRENSKRSQPLSTSDGQDEEDDAETRPAASTGDGAMEEPELADADAEAEERVVYKPVRRRLPDERPSFTHKFSIAGHEGYLHVGLYPETQRPGEIFITMAKQGSTLAGMMDAFATSISIALQYGVPLEDLCRKFSHMRFEPSGFTNNKQIPIAKSIMDYIFRYLSLKFLDEEAAEPDVKTREGAAPTAADDVATQSDVEGRTDPNEAAAGEADRSGPATDAAQGELAFDDTEAEADAMNLDGGEGVTGDAPTEDAPAEGDGTSLVGQTVEAFMDQVERTAGTEAASQAKAEATVEAKRASSGSFQNQEDAPPCSNCGSITVRSGSCYICPNCGSSTGCG
jgi:ribonucleoside-diphosphate reductase alpha chain